VKKGEGRREKGDAGRDDRQVADLRRSTVEMPRSLVSPRTSPFSHQRTSRLRLLLLFNALALLAAGVWLRCHDLNSIPGVNGDEAWYGVKAWAIAHGSCGAWHTPTGNPLNPLLVGPLALLHLGLPPSIGLLRSVAVAGGLAALLINFLLCRWVFDRRTAAISTVLLAVLPINIAYSRFGWDAGQSLAATLPVVYLALAAVRFPARFGRWIAASILAQAVAVWVHPTNIFVAAAIPAACIAHWRRRGGDARCLRPSDFGLRTSSVIRHSSFVILALAVLVAAAWLWAAWPLTGRIAQRLGDVRTAAEAANLYPRLFTGGTIYRYVAGSQSWFQWPLPSGREGFGLDVSVFWLCLLGSAWLLWRRNSRPGDRVLVAALALNVAAFVLVAGPQAMAPGQERFAICLIGPTVLLLARGAAIVCDAASPRWRLILAAATLAGWPFLADFHTHYFRFIEQTGGQSHMTFRTAAVEPKQAALRAILAEGDGEKWIICQQWWNRWPIRYLASANRNVHVPDPDEIVASADYRRALADGRVWSVEFCGTEELRQVESRLAARRPTRWLFLDYARQPVLCVLHAGPE
jgi:hypothetical protein